MDTLKNTAQDTAKNLGAQAASAADQAKTSTYNALDKASNAVSDAADSTRAALHGVVDRAANAATPLVKDLSAKAHHATQSLADLSGKAKQHMSQTASDLMKKERELMDRARVQVRSRPMTALAVCAGSVYLLAKIFGGPSRSKLKKQSDARYSS